MRPHNHSLPKYRAKIAQRMVYLLQLALFLTLTNCSDVHFSSLPSNGEGGKLNDPCATQEACDPNAKPELVTQTVTVAATKKSSVDILFIVDNSGSMGPQLKNLADRFPNFIASLNGLDWQICVTTSDMQVEDGRLLTFPNGNKWITPSTANPQSELYGLLNNLKGGSGDERGIFAINRAIDRNEGCFRANTALSTVVLSDEDERSTGGYDKTATQYRVLESRDYPTSVFETLALKGWTSKPYTAHSIVIRPNDLVCKQAQAAEGHEVWFGMQYAELTRQTKGILGDICAVDYGAQLSFIGMNIQESLGTVPLQCEPLNAAGLKVAQVKDIIESISPALNTTATLVGNRISFAPALPANTTLKLRYYCFRTPI